jgi:hypothetical protein
MAESLNHSVLFAACPRLLSCWNFVFLVFWQLVIMYENKIGTRKLTDLETLP